MNIGMLYFDNDPNRDWLTKITGAARYYETKYGARPNLCFIHPSSNVTGSVDGIEIKTSRSILPNHVWMGIDGRVDVS